MEKLKTIEDVAAKFAKSNQDYSKCSDEVKHAIHTAVIFGHNEPWRELETLDFSDALKALKVFKPIRRRGWNGKGLFVFRQVPAHIESDIVPKMQSVPTEAKKLILATANHIDYTSQCLIYNTTTGRADSWVPSVSDMFADDWEIVDID